ncbi:hypothetical protein GCM10011316_27980 [Roseibium aquae]|uniref:Uncharacterized protein n=1 Tax=Roseibium aquae TaxID=1323746 RepID=A0A916TLE6_9HYPH|nr:hypothetical protein GCM10011316_27980 [Roseibium aquae]
MRHDAQRLGIVIKPAEWRHALMHHILPLMAKGCVAKIMRKGEAFGQILIETQGPGKGPSDLRNFDGMGKPGAEVVAFMIDEDLGLVFQPPECGGMNDPVAIPLEGCPRRTLGFGHQPPPAGLGMLGKDRPGLRAVPDVGTDGLAGLKPLVCHTRHGANFLPYPFGPARHIDAVGRASYLWMEVNFSGTPGTGLRKIPTVRTYL